MTLGPLASGRLRLAAYLEIDGLATTYYLGPVAPPAPAGRTMRPGLIDIGAVSERLDLLSALPSSASVTVRVGDAPELLRLAPTGGAPSTRLVDAMPGVQALAPLVVAVESAAGLSPGIYHVGREAIEVSAVDAVLDTITIPVNGRGALGTIIQPHVVSPLDGWQPRLYSAVVAWRQRGARVWVGQLGLSGWIGQPAVEVEGRIGGLPTERDGVISLQIDTLAAALGDAIGTADRTETTLSREGHPFHTGIGNLLAPLHMRWPRGALWRERFADAPGSAVITAPAGGMGEAVDFAAGQIVLLSQSPGAPTMVVQSVTAGPDGFDDPLTTLNLQSPPGVTISGYAQSIASVETPFVDLSSAGSVFPAGRLRAWPEALADSVIPGWAEQSVTTDGEIVVTPRWSLSTPGPLLLRPIAGRGYSRQFTAGLFFGESPVTFDPTLLNNRAVYNIPAVELTAEPTTLRASVADAWYQSPERYLYTRDGIAPGASLATPVLVQVEMGERTANVRIVGQSPAPAPFGGWLLELHPEDRMVLDVVVDVVGGDRPVLRAVAGVRRASVGRFVRRLLTSVAGTGSNGGSDVLPYGAALPTATVAPVTEMARVPGTLGPRSVVLREATTVGAIIGNLLRSEGYALSTRLNLATRRRQLYLISTGLPSPADVVDTITDGDWLTDGRPVLGVDQRVVNSITFELDADRARMVGDQGEGDEYNVLVHDLDSIGESGARMAETIQVIGAEIDADDRALLREKFVPIAQARFAAYGYPRRTIAGSIAYARGAGLDAGAVVRLQGRELRGYDGAPVAEVLARVTSITRDVMAASCAIELAYWQVRTAGWAPALRVNAVAGVTVTVDANNLAPDQDRFGRPQSDVDFFAVGDPVLLVPPGDYTSAAALTITGIAANVLTLSGAPPAGIVGGSVRHQSYAAGPARIRDFAAQAPLTGDPAQVYS